MKNTMPPDRFLLELNRAIALHQQNRLVEAEPIYRELLRLDSRHFDVVHLLGTLLRRTGALTESMSLLDRAVKMRPQSSAAQLNRANVLMDRGAFADALAGFSRAIALKPDYAEAYHGRAVALLKLGNPQSARADAQAALKLNPGILEAALTLGQSLAAEERLVEARDVFLRLLAQRPAWPEAMLELGHVLLRLNQAGKAAEVLVRARQLDPTRPAIAFELALALRDLGHTQQALLVVEQALALDSGLAQGHGLRGDLLSEHGQMEEALKSYDEAVRLAPRAPQALSARGHALSQLGRREEATASYEAALAQAPHDPSAIYGLSRQRTFSAEDPLLAKMREAQAMSGLADDARSKLCFAIAKAFEDTGDLALSFAALQEANALRKKVLGYRFEQDEALFGALAAAAPGLMAAASGLTASADQPVPVFIVGMPRSGTTLLEQILSGGPDVQGAGELNFVKQYGLDLATGRTPPKPEALQAFAAQYLAAIAQVSNGKPWVVDKMPLNFRFVPLICAALPQARILHIHRNPRAVCWSNFKHYFAARGMGFAYDLDALVRYYRLYADMMERWNELCPGRLVDIDYERLTDEPETETRRIIAHLSLPWHADYLAPEKNARLVHTASADQVRQAIYRGSSDVWRAFAPFMGEAFDNLPPA